MEPAAEQEAEELARFFRELSPASRREYEALAEADRAYGEDLEAERRAAARSPG
jgi:hypothetical protein